MTVGRWTIPAWPWAYAVMFLALYGLFDLCQWAAGRLRGLAGRVRWWLRDRVTPLLEDGWREGDERLEPLPPERSWEQMTHHQLPVVGMSPAERKDWRRRERGRERLAGAAERQHRGHYAAMGLEYPSGLIQRVREGV